ncbi:MAG: coniferyl aldehyde dehydrogenase [Pseudomonadota bacterium]
MKSVLTQSPLQSPELADMSRIFELQRQAFCQEGAVPAACRLDRIHRGIASILKFQDPLVEALNEDFGSRSRTQSLLTDVAATVSALKYTAKHFQSWMAPEKRHTSFPLNLLGGRSRIEYQPLGVVGAISPWNFPAYITFGPLGDILAAGNRCMIKPSEYTPKTAEVMSEIVRDAWDESEVAMVMGDHHVGEAFSNLPFDHLLFTGSTAVGREVMTAAARNLVPVTLELGGKSPVIIGRDANLQSALSRIMLGKTLNAGQICISPDYLLVAEERVDEVLSEISSATALMYPKILDNPQYTSIINQRHYDRLQHLIQDAVEKGGTATTINPGNEDFASNNPDRKLPPTVLTDVTDDMRVMQEEIFGPILPLVTYDSIDSAIDYVNSKPRPLALYYFGENQREQRTVLDRTVSGGVCINDVAMHLLQEDLPFGGVGASGMGRHMSKEGFQSFSHAKSIYKQSRLNVAGLAGLTPPYGKRAQRTIRMQTRF